MEIQIDKQNERENLLWHTAKKRTEFKWSLTCYLIINAFLTGVWFMGSGGHFWPLWCMIGWGIGLAFQYFKAYHKNHLFSIEKEYEKLKSK